MCSFVRTAWLVVPMALSIASSPTFAWTWSSATTGGGPFVTTIAQRSTPLNQGAKSRVKNSQSARYCVWPVPLGCKCRRIDYSGGCCTDMFCSMKTHQ
jgi:hypothetical protein